MAVSFIVEETAVPEENHWSVISHWQILSHNVVSSTGTPDPWVGFELITLVVLGTDCTGTCKSNHHTITTTAVPEIYNVYIKPLKSYQHSGPNIILLLELCDKDMLYHLNLTSMVVLISYFCWNCVIKIWVSTNPLESFCSTSLMMSVIHSNCFCVLVTHKKYTWGKNI